MQLRPSEIYFSQAEINNRFRKTTDHGHKNVGETLDDLMNGICSIEDIPKIEVRQMNGKWLTADNRRLWVFRHLEKLGRCTTIPVALTSYINPQKMDSTNGGINVQFHPGRSASGYWHRQVSSIDPDSYMHANRSHWQSQSNYTAYQPTSGLRSPKESLDTRNLTSVNNILRSLRLQTSSNSSKLDPSDIRYTKENITLTKFFEDLKTKLMLNEYYANEIGSVDVYKVFGKYWVADGNKRLWSFKGANATNTEVEINADIKEDKDEFLDMIRKDRPYMSLIDILQSGESIQISY